MCQGIIRHYSHYATFVITPHADWDDTCGIIPHGGGIITIYHYTWSERSRAKDNNWLGTFNVAVPLAPRGKSAVNVVFEIDANGILSCSGEEVTTGLKRKMIVTNNRIRIKYKGS
ncbi:putative Heat shock protein 70 family [Helianthus annuus]|nr:putative Heat shock protein 70 family [Helianthus annuus]